MTSKYICQINLTLKQKDLFEAWLNAKEIELVEELKDIKSLRSQMLDTEKSIATEVKSTSIYLQRQSWTSMLLDAMKQLGDSAQTSTQIVTWFMDNDLALKEKGKRYITKNVTSKLALLVEKGRIEKKVMGGKNVYALKS